MGIPEHVIEMSSPDDSYQAPLWRLEKLTSTKKQADYIVNKLHGISWNRCDVDYNVLESLISRATTRAETVYVKGSEIKKITVKYTPTPVVYLCMFFAHSSVWLGALSADQLLSKIALSAVIVINTDLHTKPGTYWNAIFIPKNGFPLDGVNAKRVIVGMSVTNSFTSYAQLEIFGGNCVVINRTKWQVQGNPVISKSFSNTQPPQKISLTNHEIPLRRMCSDRMVIISERQDAGFKRVAYLALSWARLCEVWDLIAVAIDRRDMCSTPVARYCNDLIDTLVVDVCNMLTDSVNVIDVEKFTSRLVLSTPPNWHQSSGKIHCHIDGECCDIIQGRDLFLYCRSAKLVPGMSNQERRQLINLLYESELSVSSQQMMR
uniref:Uncharacterized protein n=1 Tax=Timema cristinae TaxID=61476 RepID=A0A7R9DBB8_TIMCR|nr:unnamed protein product [Timema cristinae]